MSEIDLTRPEAFELRDAILERVQHLASIQYDAIKNEDSQRIDLCKKKLATLRDAYKKVCALLEGYNGKEG